MSWKLHVPATRVDELDDALNDAPVVAGDSNDVVESPAGHVREQVDAVREAVRHLLRSGSFGGDQAAVVVSAHGHANAGHANPAEGEPTDHVAIEVRQHAAQVPASQPDEAAGEPAGEPAASGEAAGAPASPAAEPEAGAGANAGESGQVGGAAAAPAGSELPADEGDAAA